MSKTRATDDYWARFKVATATTADSYEVVAFGDSAAMADELAALVVNGAKRATAGLARDFEFGHEPMPVAGDHVVLVDGAGTTCCVWRTTEVTVKPLNQVDAAFAWDEGEGDRTLADWLDGHHRFFKRQAAEAGFTFHEDIATVFERFEVVWRG